MRFLTCIDSEKGTSTLYEVINGKPVDIHSIELDGVDMRDYGDFSDAYADYATFEDGTELSDDEQQNKLSLKDNSFSKYPSKVNSLIKDNSKLLEAQIIE